MSVEATAFDPRPDARAAWLTGIAGLVAVGAGAVTIVGAAVGLLGLVVMVIAVLRGRRRLHTVATLALFGGVLLAGFAGASPVLVVAGTAATVVAWDVGENAIGLGQQLGARADTGRSIAVHAGTTVLVAVGVAVVTIVSFRLARRGQPSAASVLLLLAALLFTWLLDRYP